MERESFVFYKSFVAWIDVIQDEAEQLKAYKYIIRYWVYWEEPEEKNSIAYGFFAMAKPQIDANNKKYTDWCKGWRPPKNWDNSQKPKVSEKITCGSQNWKPNVNDNDNVNDNEKESEGKHKTNMLDASASRNHDVEKRAVAKKDEVEALRLKLIENQIDAQVIEKIIEFDDVKKWTKIRKYKEPQLKAFITTLNTRFTNEEKLSMLNTCIWNGYQWIYKNNRAKPIEKPKVSWNLFH